MAAKQTDLYNTDQVAQIAATLLQGRPDAEPHNVKAAVVTAKVIIDEANGRPSEAERAAAEVAAAEEAAAEEAAEAQATADAGATET